MGITPIDVTASLGASGALASVRPDMSTQAKFSMLYIVAYAVTNLDVGLSAFADAAVNNDGLFEIAERTSVTVDDKLAYDSHTATIQIATADREQVEQIIENPPGTI